MKVPVTTVIASTAPKMAERTGTALRPLPGSNARRTPATVDTGNPADAIDRTKGEVRVAASRLRPASLWGAAR